MYLRPSTKVPLTANILGPGSMSFNGRLRENLCQGKCEQRKLRAAQTST